MFSARQHNMQRRYTLSLVSLLLHLSHEWISHKNVEVTIV